VLSLDAFDTPVKVLEPCQMLGEIAPDLIVVLGVDVVLLGAPTTMFGVQPLSPVENVLALYETVREYGQYSIL
jgi:hypothetical protein